MRVPNHLEGGRFGFNMTPMIDVVFLLIIFFLVSSHLAKQEVQMELPLPGADSGEEIVDDQNPHVIVNVLQDGMWVVAGRRLPAASTKQQVSQLNEILRNRIKAVGKDVEVRIRSDRSVPYQAVEPIMRSCATSGIWNVTFAVYRREDIQ